MAVALDEEREIVATLTSSSACEEYYRAGLSAEHFADARCRLVFSWSMEFFLSHGRMEEAPSIEVIETEFPDYRDLIAETGGAAPSYLSQRLKSRYIRRQADDVMREMLPMLDADPMAGATAIRDSFSAIVDNCVSAEDCLEYGADMDAYRKKMDERRDQKGVPYPFDEMQRWTGGINDGELAVLVAPPGKGKSVFACKMALEAVRKGYNVYFASLELAVMNITERIEYMVVNEDGLRVPISEYRRGARRPEYTAAIYEAQDKIAAMPGRLFVDHPRMEDRTPSALVRTCKSKGCNFIIVDQLQFVTKPKRESLQESYGAALQEFKNQIMTPVDGVRLPMLLLHQMNRLGAKAQHEGTGKVGSMSDIAGSAWVEQISDIVWGLGRNAEEENNGVMNIATLKVRNVEPVGYRLSWDTSLTYQFDTLRDENGVAQRLESW